MDDQRTMLLSVSDDLRVLLIALAAACMFQQHIDDIDEAFRLRLCRQSLQLFAPVAARLGMYALKYRLERSAFPECYPSDAALIGSQLQRFHSSHATFLHQTAGAIRTFLEAQGLPADVMAREKQPFSIFQKMRTRGLSSLENITDLFAVRVVVSEPQDCYQALGLLHRLGTPISHRFKDYISFPKPNGYQSLHTCILGLPHAPSDVMVEVQIRTHSMHQEAEYGVAAHWLYKTGASRDADDHRRSLAKDGTLPMVDHIYVLTPKGDIIELPDGARPLDFAFHVHTDLGLRFKAARVNGVIAPISHRLENGDVVDVQTHSEPRPALQWIEQLVSSSARSKLKTYFFSHNRDQFLTRGREMVNTELRARGVPRLDSDLSALAVFDGAPLTTSEREDLLVKVGMGSVRISSIFRHISGVPAAPPERRAPPRVPLTTRQGPSVHIEGSPHHMPYRFAKCCAPEQASPRPERIVGVVTRMGVVTVHSDACRMIRTVNPDRRLPMCWDDAPKTERATTKPARRRRSATPPSDAR